MANGSIPAISPPWARMHAEEMYRKLLARSEAEKVSLKKSVDVRYLPFINPDHPVLLDLQGRAYGTFLHSVMVGEMAGSSAYKIGANADLARAQAYYHDLGKMEHPEIFAESHDGRRWVPTRPVSLEGLKIILGHPKEARRMLEESGFPPEIYEAAEQHHGNLPTRVQLEPGILSQVSADQLHYSGPLPSSRESAIVMLADQTQSIFAKMRERGGEDWQVFPPLDYVKGFVATIGLGLWDAGQFSDSQLTEAEYEKVKQNINWWLFKFYNDLSTTETPYADDMQPGEKRSPHPIRGHARKKEEE